MNLLQVKEPEVYQRPKRLADGNKSIQQRKLEFVDDDYFKGKKEKQNYIYDTPGIFHDSQVRSSNFSTIYVKLELEKWCCDGIDV